jgi:chromosomal replication initiation ATPase DnaA
MTHTARSLIEETAKFFGLEAAEVMGVDRHKTIAEARAVSMWLIRNVLKMSYPQIAREFSGYKRLPDGSMALHTKDHTSVMSSVRRVDTSQELTRLAERILITLQGVRSVGLWSDATGAREIEFVRFSGGAE